MSGPGYVFKDSGTTPPAGDEHINRTLGESTSGQQTHVKLDPNGNALLAPENNPPHRNHESNAKKDARVGSHGNETTSTNTGSRLKDKAFALVEQPTETLRKEFTADSHDLAHESPKVKGAIQKNQAGLPNEALLDIGWHKPNVDIPDPLIGGISNGRLFAMIRRFNKVRRYAPLDLMI